MHMTHTNPSHRNRLLVSMQIALLLGVGVVSAQTEPLIEANIPFSFMAGGAALPAGQYTVRVDLGEGTDMLEIRSHDGTHSVWVFVNRERQSSQAPPEAELVFARYGAVNYLTEVWGASDAGRYHGFELERTPHEAKTAARADRRENVRVKHGS